MSYHDLKFDSKEEANDFSHSLNNNLVIDHAWNPVAVIPVRTNTGQLVYVKN